MKNKELIEEITARLNCPTKETEEMMDALISSISSCLLDDDTISFQGFGQFEVKKKAERLCVNPTTGKRYLVPPKLVAVFKPGSSLRNLLKNLDNE